MYHKNLPNITLCTIVTTSMMTFRSSSTSKKCRCTTGGVWVGGEMCLSKPVLFRSWNAKQLKRKVKANISLTPLRHVLNPLTALERASFICNLNSMKTLTFLIHTSCLYTLPRTKVHLWCATVPSALENSIFLISSRKAHIEDPLGPWTSYLFLSFRRDTSWVCCKSCFSSRLVERVYSNSWISSRLVWFSTCKCRQIMLTMQRNTSSVF